MSHRRATRLLFSSGASTFLFPGEERAGSSRAKNRPHSAAAAAAAPRGALAVDGRRSTVDGRSAEEVFHHGRKGGKGCQGKLDEAKRGGKRRREMNQCRFLPLLLFFYALSRFFRSNWPLGRDVSLLEILVLRRHFSA